ncbi:transposase [Brochothrix campestris FSL F6-1037]|uniref:Transposase n=1 Tax=Brochothrix campestris FSL F6-1037 TaxID=1265861 RepID=W7CSN0_9LIST|nr:transposase [Brochothrix campestris FSL F6-1037]
MIKYDAEFKMKVVRDYLKGYGGYQYLANKQQIKSMSRKGNCLDNSLMEDFFGLLKQEMYYGKVFHSFEELKGELEKGIHYYNHKRVKLKLNGLSPVAYRLKLTA